MARPKGGSAHFVYGVCTNLDKDGNGTPCPKCTSKEIIKLSAHADFVCPECGDSLKKVEPPKDWKKPIIIGCAAAVSSRRRRRCILCIRWRRRKRKCRSQ